MTRRRWVAAPAVVAVLAVLAASAKGLYVSPDAVFYVGTARNWLDGRGFTPPPGVPPLEHFPPLFPFLLGMVGRIGIDPLTAARVVNLACLAGVVLLVGVVVRRQTGSSVASLVASVLTAAAVELLTLSGSALSEPLFILLALGGLVALAAHIERPSPAMLAASSALVGAALLSRYVGIALVGAGVLALLWRRRWGDAGVFGAISVAPVALWLALTESAGDRSFVVHLFGVDYLGQAARPVARWFVPWPTPPAGLLLALVIVAAGSIVLCRPAAGSSRSALSGLLAAFAGAYLLLLLANRALTDATGRLDARFLAPLHIVAILLVLPALWRRRPLPRPAVVLAGAIVVGQVVGALVWAGGGLTDDSVRRRGYTSADLRRSPVLAVAGEPLYSNAVDAVWFVTGRTSTAIPATKDYLTGEPNPRYPEQLAAMRAAGGYLIYLDAVTFRRSFQPSRAELEAVLPLEVIAHDAIGTAYRLR